MAQRGGVPVAATLAMMIATAPAHAQDPDCPPGVGPAEAAANIHAAAAAAKPCLRFAPYPVPDVLRIDVPQGVGGNPGALATLRARMASARAAMEKSLVEATDCEALLLAEAAIDHYYTRTLPPFAREWARAYPNAPDGYSGLTDLYVDRNRDDRIGAALDRLSGEWRNVTDPVAARHCGQLRLSPVQEAAAQMRVHEEVLAVNQGRPRSPEIDAATREILGINGIVERWRNTTDQPFGEHTPKTLPGMTDRYLFSRNPQRVRDFVRWEAQDREYSERVRQWLHRLTALPAFATPETVAALEGAVDGWSDRLSEHILHYEPGMAPQLLDNLWQQAQPSLSTLGPEQRLDRVSALLTEARMTLVIQYAVNFANQRGKPLDQATRTELVRRLDGAGRAWAEEIRPHLSELPAPPELPAATCGEAAPVADQRAPGLHPSTEAYLDGMARAMGFSELPVPTITVRNDEALEEALAKLDERQDDIPEGFEGSMKFFAEASELVGIPNPYYSADDTDIDALKAILRRKFSTAYATYNGTTEELELPAPDPNDEMRLGAEVHEGFHFLRDTWLKNRGTSLGEFHEVEETSRVFDKPMKNSDAELAREAIVEGEAVLVQLDYMNLAGQGMTARIVQENFRMLGTGLYATDDPIQQNHSLAYGMGLSFLEAGRTYHEIDGNGKITYIELLERLYENPPVSSEQILHPRKYFTDVDLPTFVDPDKMMSAFPEDWEVVLHDLDGEMGLIQTLATRLMPPPGHADEQVVAERILAAAAGWDGDRGMIIKTGDGKPAYVQYFTFDTPGDARAFAVELGAYSRSLPHDRAYTITTPSRPHDVIWIAGPEREFSNRLAQRLFAADPAGHDASD